MAHVAVDRRVRVAVLKAFGGSGGGRAALEAVRAARDTRGLLHIHSALEEGGQRMLQAATTSQRVKGPPSCGYWSQRTWFAGIWCVDQRPGIAGRDHSPVNGRPDVQAIKSAS